VYRSLAMMPSRLAGREERARRRTDIARSCTFVIKLTNSYTCQLLGQSNSGATCEPIGGNGSTGVYGDLSYCNPATKLNYAISAYYEYDPVDTSCDFAGNATLASPRMSFFLVESTNKLLRDGCRAF
jgi:hypothetical protein